MHVNEAADYIILKVVESGEELNNLKLQKLLYYSKVWYLVNTGNELFADDFQAWIHGPVCRTVYDRFASSKSLYSSVDMSDLTEGFNPDKLDESKTALIDAVLGVYAKFSGSQLETLSHSEAPWLKAREGYLPMQRCENVISNSDISTFYGNQIKR